MLQNEWIKKVALAASICMVCLCTAPLTRAADSSEDYLKASPKDVQAWRAMRFAPRGRQT